jgi:hypothetical protein
MSDNSPRPNATVDDADADADAAPAPAPWAFAAVYTQPLPPALQFGPHTGFTAMADYVRTTLPDHCTHRDPFKNAYAGRNVHTDKPDTWRACSHGLPARCGGAYTRPAERQGLNDHVYEAVFLLAKAYCPFCSVCRSAVRRGMG